MLLSVSSAYVSYLDELPENVTELVTHVRTVDTRYSSPVFLAPGNEAKDVLNHCGDIPGYLECPGYNMDMLELEHYIADTQEHEMASLGLLGTCYV